MLQKTFSRRILPFKDRFFRMVTDIRAGFAAFSESTGAEIGVFLSYQGALDPNPMMCSHFLQT